jgi:hypothetical protein
MGVMDRGAWTIDADRKELIAECYGCGNEGWSGLLQRRRGGEERMR